MTLREYRLRMKAYDIRRVYEIHDIHLLAFRTREATATNKKGDKYIFPSFTDFYDIKAALAKATNRGKGSKKEAQISRLRDIAKRNQDWLKTNREEDN